MKRAAIYARFSSDQQNERSIGDQVALCCEYATRQGYSVARVFEDAAASGASMHGRPGIRALLADKIVALHPTALARYLAAVESLAATLARRLVAGNEECAAALRELIAAVVIHPGAQPGDPRIKVTGRLSQLTGDPVFPSTVVAGARFSRSRHAFLSTVCWQLDSGISGGMKC
jgi:hypothetical protein